MRSLIVLAAVALAACAPEPPPEAAVAEKTVPQAVPENIHVVVNPDGRIFWQGEEISEGEFYRRMGEAMAQRPGPFALAIRADGTYALDGTTLTLEQLDAMLSGLSTAEPVPEVYVEADNLAKYRDVAAAMTALQRHGMTKVAVLGGGAE